MRLLALLHRWTGAMVGLILVALGLSGTLLLWKAEWIDVPGAGDPLRPGTHYVAAAVITAARQGELSRITFASDDFGLHQAIYSDGSGAYIDQNASVVARWSGKLDRPELWLFDLHHYLLAGESGETIVGVAGLALVLFTISGVILWWRTRRTFALRALPARITRSAILRHHRDLGVVAAPLLLLSGLTGALMVFPSLTGALLAPWGQLAPKFDPPSAAPARSAPDWEAMLEAAGRAFPDATPRRLQLPKKPGEPILIRLRQGFEWTPNGRSYAYVDPATEKLVARIDPARQETAQALQEKLYPLHSAMVGGIAWRVALTLSGLSLVLLGFFATWSFWFLGPARGRRVPAPARTPRTAQ